MPTVGDDLTWHVIKSLPPPPARPPAHARTRTLTHTYTQGCHFLWVDLLGCKEQPDNELGGCGEPANVVESFQREDVLG